MITAGLVARKANELGLKVPDYVKTSLAPGSKVVVDYLDNANLLKSLSDIGFKTVGFGCTTCIGNSGPFQMMFLIRFRKILYMLQLYQVEIETLKAEFIL